jgi:sterol desaturase/sphingolipid hydroxylase (fatty acid hydroxylase superfamily)
MLDHLVSLLLIIAAVYAVLLATYFFSCLALTKLSHRMVERKIQTRTETRAQINRDQRQSMVSIAGIATMFGIGHWAYQSLGYGIQVQEPSFIYLVGSFILSLLLFDTWFYWMHRLIHTRFLYRKVHSWHHQTVTPEAWSNNSDLLIDNLFLQSYWLVAHFLIPIAPIALFIHKLYDQVSGVIGHSGYELTGSVCWPPSPLISVTHHDQHHQFVRCNYATHFTFWDRLMGTLHPMHDDELKRNLLRSIMRRGRLHRR